MNIFKKHISVLIIDIAFAVDFVYVVLQFNGGYLTSLGELLPDLLLSGIFWNESNENVRFEGFLLILDDWIGSTLFLALEELVVFLVDVRHHNHSIVVDLDLHLASLVDRLLCILVFTETHITGSWLFGVEFMGSDRTVDIE